MSETEKGVIPCGCSAATLGTMLIGLSALIIAARTLGAGRPTSPLFAALYESNANSAPAITVYDPDDQLGVQIINKPFPETFSWLDQQHILFRQQGSGQPILVDLNTGSRIATKDVSADLLRAPDGKAWIENSPVSFDIEVNTMTVASEVGQAGSSSWSKDHVSVIYRDNANYMHFAVFSLSGQKLHDEQGLPINGFVDSSWSADGSMVAARDFNYKSNSYLVHIYNLALNQSYVLDTTGLTLTASPLSWGGGAEFVVSDASGNTYRTVIINAETGAHRYLHPVSSVSENSPVFSPDGKFIAYIGQDGQHVPELVLCSVSGEVVRTFPYFFQGGYGFRPR